MTDTKPATNPFEQALADHPRRYGIPVTVVGEDGDWIVAPGHIDPRRMAAAAQAASRDLTGERLFWNSYDNDAWAHPLTYALTKIRHTHALLRQPYCSGCREHQPGECSEEYPWGLDWSEDTPGRDVPITILDWS